jgi:hypothetical protein
VLSTVLSSRVDPGFLQQVKTAAKAAGRSVSEEVMFRAQQAYAWEAALEDAATIREKAYSEANAILAAAKRVVREDAALEEMADRAAMRAIEKMREQS